VSAHGLLFTRVFHRFDTRNLNKIKCSDFFGLYKSYYSKCFYLWDKQKGELHEFVPQDVFIEKEGLPLAIEAYNATLGEKDL